MSSTRQNNTLRLIFISIFVVFICNGCYMHVNWENWKSEGGPVIVDGVEFSINIRPISTGVVSGGTPYALSIDAMGDKGIHSYLEIHSISLKLGAEKEIFIQSAKGLKRAFIDPEKIAYPEGKHGFYIHLTEEIDIDYKNTDKIICTANISVKKKGVKINSNTVVINFIKNHYSKWQWVNFLDV